MMEIPTSAWVRGYVLNYLEKGPVRVADLVRVGATEFGFTEQQIRAAGDHFAVSHHVVDGEMYWMRPTNLFAIWWAKRCASPPSCQRRHTG